MGRCGRRNGRLGRLRGKKGKCMKKGKKGRRYLSIWHEKGRDFPALGATGREGNEQD